MRFSQHARRRMAARGIAEHEVLEALADRETTYAGRRAPSVVVLGRTSAGRPLKIVVADDVVVTVARRDHDQ